MEINHCNEPLVYAIDGAHSFIHRITLEEFQKRNPPCNECLIQSMCLEEDFDDVHTYIRLNPCTEFIKFLGIKVTIQ